MFTGHLSYYQKNKARCLEYARRYRAVNRVKISTKKRLYNKQHREDIVRNNRLYRQQNPEKTKCHRIRWKAIRAGELIIGPCAHKGLGECGTRIQSHHEDYSKPLDVTWFCISHHQQHHRSVLAFREGCMTSKKLQESDETN